MASRQESAPTKKAPRQPAGAVPHGGPAQATPVDQAQAENYERAVQAFQREDYNTALKLFEKAAEGPMREMAHSARLRANICAARMTRRELTLATPDEHYDYAIALMNQGKLSQAEQHLALAVTHAPQADHVYYALALCRGLAGDFTASYMNLKRAIELHPRNRIAARNDPDFSEIAKHPLIATLLYPEARQS
jgi:tetratricopeptide (TPR) repeat protein